MKVIVYLRTMSIIQCAYRFQFHNYLPIADKICFVSLLQLHTIVNDFQLFFTFIRNITSLELYFQSLLIYSLKETMS